MLEKDLRRFIAKTSIQPNGCVLWTGWTNGKYGGFGFGTTKVYAHRVAYEHWVGPIPDGLTIDHLCRVPLCVNPDHLEPVTMHENLARGDSWKAISLYHRPNQAMCGNGLHAWVPENLKPHGNGYKCRLCHNLASLASKRRKKGR